MNKYLTEFIGTFFLVLTIGLVVVNGTPMAPIAIGAVLMVLVFMGGHVSGAHYNPAVSLALLIRKEMEKADFAPYVAAQVLGAAGAALLVSYLKGENLVVAPTANTPTMAPLILEVLFTFILTLVILNVATSRKTEGNSYYGLAIGFTVMAGAFAAGPISGGAFNPAVALGPIVVNGNFGDLWIYLVGPFGGAVLATGAFELQEKD